MKLRAFAGLLAVVFTILACETSEAGFVLSAHDGAVFQPSNVVVTQGSTQTLTFLLTQTGTETRLTSAATGLLQADTRVTVSGSDIVPTLFAINSSFVDAGASGITGSSVEFDLVNTATGATTANDTASLDASGNSVVLGTATFSISPTATIGLHNVDVTAVADAFGDRFSLNPLTPVDVDPQTTSFQFQVVSAVPEPSSIAILMMGTVAAIMTRRRR